MECSDLAGQLSGLAKPSEDTGATFGGGPAPAAATAEAAAEVITKPPGLDQEEKST